jgi:hypothetical protein
MHKSAKPVAVPGHRDEHLAEEESLINNLERQANSLWSWHFSLFSSLALSKIRENGQLRSIHQKNPAYHSVLLFNATIGSADVLNCRRNRNFVMNTLNAPRMSVLMKHRPCFQHSGLSNFVFSFGGMQLLTPSPPPAPPRRTEDSVPV